MDLAVVTVRPMRWWDVAQVAAMEPLLFGADAWSEATVWTELSGVPTSRFYVVACVGGEDAEQVVGYAGLAADGPTLPRLDAAGTARGGSADIQTLAVHPDYRRCGIGSRLLEELFTQARHRECASMMLEVRADNTPALKLYEQHGFERLSTRRGYYEAGRVNGLVLRRRLEVDEMRWRSSNGTHRFP